MNLILLDRDELVRGVIPAEDPRSQHIRRVLRAEPGSRLKAGVVDGPRGVLKLLEWRPSGWAFSFAASEPAPPSTPLTVLLAVGRPPVMRRILRDCASLGCQEVLMFPARLGEGDYRRSHLWEQIPALLREGAQQGGRTRLPKWRQFPHLEAAFGHLLTPGLWCDCVPAPSLLYHRVRWPLAVAIGPERGWSEGERRIAAEHGWQPVSLGRAILRCELAAQLATGVLCQRWELGR